MAFSLLGTRFSSMLRLAAVSYSMSYSSCGLLASESSVISYPVVLMACGRSIPNVVGEPCGASQALKKRQAAMPFEQVVIHVVSGLHQQFPHGPLVEIAIQRRNQSAVPLLMRDRSPPTVPRTSSFMLRF